MIIYFMFDFQPFSLHFRYSQNSLAVQLQCTCDAAVVADDADDNDRYRSSVEVNQIDQRPMSARQY